MSASSLKGKINKKNQKCKFIQAKREENVRKTLFSRQMDMEF